MRLIGIFHYFLGIFLNKSYKIIKDFPQELTYIFNPHPNNLPI